MLLTLASGHLIYIHTLRSGSLIRLREYLLGWSWALTSSRRRVLPSKSFISSNPRSIPRFDKNPRTVGFTVTTALTLTNFSVAAGLGRLATAFMLLPTKPVRIFFWNEDFDQNIESEEAVPPLMPWTNGPLCKYRKRVVEVWDWWWTPGFNIFVGLRWLNNDRNKLETEKRVSQILLLLDIYSWESRIFVVPKHR